MFGPLDIPYFAGCPWPNALYWIANAADAAATDAGIDVSAYDNKFYLVPPESISDCPWIAVGEVGFYSSTGVYRAWSTRNDTVAYAHELGHNQGWHHAAYDPDNDGSVNNKNEEYGDTSDIMGFCCSERKFNSAHVDQIGWFDASPADIVTVLASGSYQIAPLGSGNGFGDPQILKIDKPDTNEVYYLSYRQPNGLDASISSTYTRGVNIHHARETGIWSFFIDALVDGESFVDGVNGVTVTQVAKTGDYVTVDVTFAGCSTAAPSVALGPPSQTTLGGGPVTYDVSVTNEDSAGCDPASFDLAAGDLGGLAGDVVPSSLDLAAGTTGAATLTVQADGADGGYTLWAWASDAEGLRDDAGGSASLEIDATPPLAPTGLTTAKKKVKGKLGVQVTWDAGVDPDPSSGVAAYRLYRDGAPIADTADLGYIDKNVTNGVIYSYTLRAVDNAGNWSGFSSPAAYPPDGGSDSGGDGGTKSGKGFGKGGKPK